MTKLLISGVPGAGKTTLASHLEANHGFFHIDMERDDFAARKELLRDSSNFLGECMAHENVVLSWGFRPYKDRSAVEQLIAAGFTAIWLDGDRVASFRNFMQREQNNPFSEATYYEQMHAILITRIVETIQPVIINPFMDTGQFKPIADIASEVLAGLPTKK